MDHKDKQPTEDPRYTGNLWGWRFSFISLIIILFFVGMIVVRHWMLGEPFDSSKIKPPIPVEEDSTKSEPPRTDSLQ